MRRFIYLDTDTLNSYLAQIFDGLIQSQEMEKSAGKKKEKQNHFGSNLGSQIAFKLFGKGIDANAQATYEHLKTVANDEMVRDVQTKIMHDNAFDEFASYLSENGLLGGANIGNFISVEDEFYIFDILCLNYDGKFGLNNMNSYFQNANTETAVVWRDWKYKVGDHILFNDTDRFSLLYNNLKGRIVQIELFDSRIRFTVDVEIPLTEQDCQNDGIEFIDIIDDVTRIRFDVFDFEEEMADEDRKKAIVPFQLAYAVSIHKAQGLEYRSVKVVIPSSNAEKITHGIFYTAITRAKEKLKIYWSSETMQEVVAGFSIDTSRQKSLAIIKEKLKQDKNT